jgi:hypothetical protein
MDAADADCVIAFLDELREVLVTAYGDDIIAMHQAILENRLGQQQCFDFGNEVNF